jgi:hypothetical protein
MKKETKRTAIFRANLVIISISAAILLIIRKFTKAKDF